MIIVPRGEIRLTTPKRQVYPGPGELLMRCGKCGGTTFQSHVKPHAWSGKVKALACTHCGAVYKLDNRALVEGDGKQEKVNGSND